MKKTTRILCLAIAAVFVVSLLFSIAMSIAYAEEDTSASSRGETVYVTADANGTIESVISSVYLGNDQKRETVTDYTSLTDIKAITTNEPPAISGDVVTFDAAGEDVSYQGTANAEDLPFMVHFTYFLNGKQIAPEDLAGKSGRVRIEIATENRLKRTYEVDGEQVELYVPFSIIGMLTLDESFTGITAQNAKISVQAGQVTVLCVLLPGLKESLGLQENNEKISDTLTIEATVKDFNFDGGMFIGMTGIVDQNDLSGIEDVEELMRALTELNDAASQLYRGARRLDKAAEAYAEGVRAYAEGIAQAAEGAGALTDGVSELYKGADQLAGGSGEITGGLESLAAELNKLKAALDTIESGEVDEALYSFLVSWAVEAAQKTLDAYNAELRDRLRAQLEAAMPDATPEEIEAIVDAVIPVGATVPKPELTDEQKAEIAAKVSEIIQKSNNTQEIIAKFEALISGVNQLADGSSQVTDGLYALTGGLRQLKEGLSEFANGAAALQENGATLSEGADSLASGIGKIASGLRSLANDGMQRIVDETAEIDITLSRKDALIALSQSYSSFSATREPEDGAVQFVLSVDGIEEELPIEPSPTPGEDENVPADVEKTEERGFFERIGAWFEGIFTSVKGWFD